MQAVVTTEELKWVQPWWNHSGKSRSPVESMGEQGSNSFVVDANLPCRYRIKLSAGVRYLSPDEVGDTPVDTDPEYVGLPTSYSQLPLSTT
jgi:hypothetical protein